MKKVVAGALMVSIVGFASAQAQELNHGSGYVPLSNYIGRWTTRGNESTFVEVCDWYHGQFHIICNSETKRADGSTSHTISILSYLPDQGYVYTGIGSRGRYETHSGGTWSDGIFTFTSASSGDRSKVSRIRIGPFTEQGFSFVVDTSPDGATWVESDTTSYIRLK